jgi:hypothetical protein
VVPADHQILALIDRAAGGEPKTLLAKELRPAAKHTDRGIGRDREDLDHLRPGFRSS